MKFLPLHMEDRLENRWTHENTLKAYNPYREIFREASAKAVRDIFEKYVKPEDKILEIGSGLGELVNLVPEYKGQIQQTEQSPRIAQANRTLTPDSNVIIANVYNLPFPDKSFDVVVGYSVFDTLATLEDALSEVKRVLVPEGRLIQFLDLQASANTLFQKYLNEGFVPFPFFELDERDGLYHERGFQLVERDKLREVRNTLIKGTEPAFDFYTSNPENQYVMIYKDPQGRAILHMLSDFVERSGVDCPKIKFNDAFKEQFESALLKEGYKIIQSGAKSGIAIVERNDKHLEFLIKGEHPENSNYFVNDIGEGFFAYDPKIEQELGPDKIKVRSNLYTVVAQKPRSNKK